MADNYLDKKLEDYKARSSASGGTRKTASSLNNLLLKNRSCRGYDSSFIVRDDQLRSIIDVNTKTPSARNAQILRFRPVNSSEAAKILPYIRLGGALPELSLPLPGTEPNAFIIICSTVPESKNVYIDLGISAQSMLLRAVEMGLAGVCIGAFDKECIKREFSLTHEPLMILAIGRSCEDIRLVEISEGEEQKYYRKNGIHYVPKLRLDDIII
jgi:nitroreductase